MKIEAATNPREDERIRLFGLLHEAHRRLDRAFNCSLEQACGISGPFFEVLLRVGRSPGGRLNMSELAAQLGVTSGGTTRLVDRMVAANLVARESCPSDRRVQWVVLSPEGARKLDDALVVHVEDLQHEVFDRLDATEIVVLERALDKLRAADELPRVTRRMTSGVPVLREIPVGTQTVGFYEYGDPDGVPVMVLHGTPACGAGFAWADAPARERGLRLLAPDRPGVGRSSRAPFTIASYPAQLAAFADALAIDRYAVWGYSGGGPYAVACAALDDRVTTTAVAAGMGQVGVWATIDESEKTDRQMLHLSTTHPAVARLLLGVSGRAARVSPKIAMKSFEKQLNARDLEIAESLGPPEAAMALFTQAFLRGAHGVVADYAAIAQPWGFDVGSITTRMEIFHGDADTMVPLRHSEELAQRVPTATLTVWPGEGHLGTIAHVGAILDGLG